MVTKLINQNLKILHTAFLYCTGLRSSNITCNSVLRQILDTARNAYCILSDQYRDNLTFFMVGELVQSKKRLKTQIKTRKQYVGF